MSLQQFNSDINEIYISCLSNLIFISYIETNQKVDIGHKQIYRMSSLTSFIRTIYNILNNEKFEGRELTLSFIQTTHNIAFNLIESKTLQTDSTKELKLQIQESLKGCINLLSTYHDDKGFCAKLTAHISEVKIHLGRI